MLTIAIANAKGGTGKTTTATNLASALAVSGTRVLAIDLDPQGNCSQALGLAVEPGTPTIGQALLRRIALPDIIQMCPYAVGVAPANRSLLDVALALEREYFKQEHLARELAGVRADYDVVVIDCPPALSVLTANAVFAADWVVVPFPLTAFAYAGLADLRTFSREVRKDDVPLSLLVSLFDARTTRLNRTLLEALEGEDYRFFSARVPRVAAIEQAQGACAPVAAFAKGSFGARAFDDVAQEVLQVLKETRHAA
jgi:chromosome partitioning protein